IMHVSSMQWYGRMLHQVEVTFLACQPPLGPQPLSFLAVAGDALPPTTPIRNAVIPVMVTGTSQGLLFTPPYSGPIGFNASLFTLTCTSVPAGLCSPSSLTFSPFNVDVANGQQLLTLTMSPNPAVPQVVYTFTGSGDTVNWVIPFPTLTVYNLGSPTTTPAQIYRTAYFQLPLTLSSRNAAYTPGYSAVAGTAQAESNCGWQQLNIVDKWDTAWSPISGSLGGYRSAGWTISTWFTLSSFAMGPRLFTMIDRPATASMYLHVDTAGAIAFSTTFPSFAAMSLTVDAATQATKGAVLQVNQPQHLAICMDQISTMRMYLNGVLIGQSAASGSLVFYSPVMASLTFGDTSQCTLKTGAGRLQLHQIHVWNHSLALLEVTSIAAYRFPSFAATSFSLLGSPATLSAGGSSSTFTLTPNGAFAGVCVGITVVVLAGPVTVDQSGLTTWCNSIAPQTFTVTVLPTWTDILTPPVFVLNFTVNDAGAGKFIAPPPQTFDLARLLSQRMFHTHFTGAVGVNSTVESALSGDPA
ncbi:MAG: hypothetical protein P4L86_17150, partial [Mycobacterium sp.]|nr:hypothetical protein [Mycobacterium sp.]